MANVINLTDAMLSKVGSWRRLRAQHYAEHLDEFFRAAWNVVNPGKKLVWSWHYDFLCEHLVLVKERKLRRLIINVPPRTAKSTLITICFPVWWWLTAPHDSFLTGSLSTDHSAARRALIASPWFQRLFADRFALSGDRNQVSAFGNDKRGSIVACSVGSRALGYGFSGCGILDDPMSATDALSDSSRAATNHWLTHTFMTRADNPAESGVVLVMQRLHERDSTAFMLESDEPGSWTHIKIPLRSQAGVGVAVPDGTCAPRRQFD